MKRICPMLIVSDVAATASFYRSKLGFEFEFPDQAEDQLAGDFAMLTRGGVTIQLKAVVDGIPRPNPMVGARQDAFIDVDDPDALCEEYRSKGFWFVSGVEESEWGTREFRFADNNGYVFCCGHGT